MQNQDNSTFVDVLISGGGVSGLVLGNVLSNFGVDYLIIEPHSSISPYSKATGLHANSSRLFHQIGLSKEIYETGILNNAINYIGKQGLEGRLDLIHGKYFFEKNLTITQFSLETILDNQISSKIARACKVIEFKEFDEFVQVTVENRDQTQKVYKCKYLIAADGAGSFIRKSLQIDFPGETSPNESCTFDCNTVNDYYENEENFITKNTRIVIVPIEGKNHIKVVGPVPKDLDRENPDAGLVKMVKERADLDIIPESVKGLCFYHVGSRVADKFGTDRVILIGDAAHIFYPFGGYGMNTGIEDAFTLAWRLNSLCKGYSKKELIKDWEDERREMAKIIQNETHINREKAFGRIPSEKFEKEILAYTFPTPRKFLRMELIVKDILEKSTFELNDDAIDEMYSGLGYKFFYSGVENLESYVKEKIENFPFKTFFKKFNSNNNVIIYARPDLQGKIFEIKEKESKKEIDDILDEIFKDLFKV